MTSTALPHDPQQLPDRPSTPRPSTPPPTASPAQPLPSPPSPPTPNALDHPVTQRPAEKVVVEDGANSPMELEDSLDDPDMNNDATMSDFAHEIDSDADYLAEDLMNDLRRVKVHLHLHFLCLMLTVYIPLQQVYELVNQTWKDLGTAFCTGDYDDAAGAQLVAKTEDTKEVVLQISIRAEEVYQRQAGPHFPHRGLPVPCSFSLPRHVDRLARTGRKRLCSQLSRPRGLFRGLGFHTRSPQTPQESGFVRAFPSHLHPYEPQLRADDPGSSPPYPEYPPASGVHIGQLPAPTLANIRDIERSLKTVVRSAPVRERIAENIVSTVRVPPYVFLQYGPLTTLPPTGLCQGTRQAYACCRGPRVAPRLACPVQPDANHPSVS